jgi:hypothetical protein
MDDTRTPVKIWKIMKINDLHMDGSQLEQEVAKLTEPAGLNPRLCSADFQSAVSPASSRQGGPRGVHPRIGNPRYSRLETCATFTERTRVFSHSHALILAQTAKTEKPTVGFQA